jgi:hypothetical protein
LHQFPDEVSKRLENGENVSINTFVDAIFGSLFATGKARVVSDPKETPDLVPSQSRTGLDVILVIILDGLTPVSIGSPRCGYFTYTRHDDVGTQFYSLERFEMICGVRQRRCNREFEGFWLLQARSLTRSRKFKGSNNLRREI